MLKKIKLKKIVIELTPLIIILFATSLSAWGMTQELEDLSLYAT